MQTIIKITKKIFTLIINFLVFISTLIVKKNKNIWLFGSWFGENFSDNSKYLYLYCINNKEKLGLDDVIWITNNSDVYKELKENNFKVFKKWSIKGIYFHLKAGYHFICQDTRDINSYFSVRSKRIQLWHGVGFKNIAMIDQVPEINTLKYKLVYSLKLLASPGMWYKHIFFSTSEFATKNIFNLSFRLFENKVIEGNYPRNIYLKEINNNGTKYLNKQQREYIDFINHEKSKGNTIILYLPTYRNLAQLVSKNEVLPLNISTTAEFINFDQFLGKNNLHFLSKFHFAGDKSIRDNRNNFSDLPIDLDIYPLLKHIDILITDYSSVYADFLFLDKPIIFYPYDLQTYKNYDKGFLFEYSDVTPGEIVLNIEELKSKILYVMKNDNYKEKRDKIRRMYFGENEEDSFESIIRKIQSVD